MTFKTSNRKLIYQIESSILWARAQTVAIQSMVEENRFLSLKNFSAAILGNRNLINQNTDDIFRDRYHIISKTKVTSDTDKAYYTHLENVSRTKILSHRHKINKAMQEINEMLNSVNRQFIEINELITETNEQLSSFNARGVNENQDLMQPSNNAQPLSMAEIAALEDSNSQELEKLYEESLQFAQSLSATYDQINNNRQQCLEQSVNNETVNATTFEMRQKIQQAQVKIIDMFD